MRRHAVHRTYVTQFKLAADDGTLPPAPPLSVASLNTHDMPPFAAFWQGLGIDDRLDLGLLTPQEAAVEHRRLARLRARVTSYLRRRGLLGTREKSPAAVVRALLEAMGRGRARIVLANLEDLWLETMPQNVPGTTGERVNWRRKARYSLEEMRQLEAVREPLLALNAARGGRRK
jgi:4-alpha-glucanotransferase